jgi:hypothetical protein
MNAPNSTGQVKVNHLARRNEIINATIGGLAGLATLLLSFREDSIDPRVVDDLVHDDRHLTTLSLAISLLSGEGTAEDLRRAISEEGGR